MLIVEKISKEFITVEVSQADKITFEQIPYSAFAGEISEGDVLKFDGKIYFKDEVQTQKRRELIKQKQQKLRGKNGG
jgi:hypothetical protein